MQKSSPDLSDEDRRVTRRWRLASLGFYGSILAGMMLYGVLSQNRDVNLASAQSAPAGSPIDIRHR